MEYFKSLLTHLIGEFLNRANSEVDYKGNFPRDLADSLAEGLKESKGVNIIVEDDLKLRCPDCGGVEFEQVSKEIKNISFTKENVDEKDGYYASEGRCKKCGLLIDVDKSFERGMIVKANHVDKANPEIAKKKFMDNCKSVEMKLKKFERNHGLNSPKFLERLRKDRELDDMINGPILNREEMESLTASAVEEYNKKMEGKESWVDKYIKNPPTPKLPKKIKGKKMDELPPKKKGKQNPSKNNTNKNDGDEEPPRESIKI